MRLRLLRQALSALFSDNPEPSAPRLRKSSRLTLEAEDRLTPSTLVVGSPGDHNYSYTSIQSAVNAANPGDTIVVEPGTYTGQVTIGAGKNNLILTTVKPAAVIQSPVFTITNASQFDSAYIVRISSSQGVTINGFTINGGTSTKTEYGIKVDSNASACITGNTITNIIGAVIGGTGIAVGESSEQTYGQAVICSNNVSGYGKVGIVIDGSGSLAAVTNNCVTGFGSKATQVQNGIQVSNGANAQVCGNNVTANAIGVNGIGADSAAGILVYYAGSSTVLQNNWTYYNEYGIFVYQTNNVNLEDNASFYNNNDGIQLQGTDNGTVVLNLSAANGGDGISVYGSVDNQPSTALNNVLNNNLTYSNVGNGVTVQDTTGTQVLNNYIADNGGSAVSLSDAVGGKVSFNFIYVNNSNPPIAVYNSSTVVIGVNWIKP